MGSAEADFLEHTSGGSSVKRWLPRVGLAMAALALAGLAYLWFSRERFAGDVIDDYLARSGLEASYDIVQIGPRRQVIENVVIGDPAAPDVTIDRVAVDLAYGFGTPQIAAVRLEGPRLFATYRGGALSFGVLDPLIFSESEAASSLPGFDLTIVDGGARLTSDFGDVGAVFEGSGPLDDGFTGTIAGIAPDLALAGCEIRRLTAYGSITVDAGAPRFEGPVRIRRGECPGAGLERADIAATLSLTTGFDSVEGELDLVADDLRLGDASGEQLRGRATFSAAADRLVLDHDVELSALTTPYASLSTVKADGAVRSARGYSQSSWNAEVEADGLSLARGMTQRLAQARKASADTLLGPLLGKLERGLERAARSGRLRADVTWRAEEEAQSLVIPQALVRNAAGETVLALSRVSWRGDETGKTQRLSGNFITGGPDLPQINGRIDQGADERLAARLTMDEFAEGTNRVAVPSLLVRQTAQDTFALSGSLRASGALPGGFVDALQVPIAGSFNTRRGLRLGTACSKIDFAALTYLPLTLGRQSLRVCPATGRAILAYQDALSLGVTMQDLAVHGELSSSPLFVGAARAELSYPGGFELEDVAAQIGAQGNALLLTSAALSGRIADELGGEFERGTAKLDAVPLDLGGLAGNWTYTDGVLRVSNARFTLTESVEGQARFEAVESADATLRLEGNAVSSMASLRHPRSGTVLADVAVSHDLSSAEGTALFDVDALQFGANLSPEDLTYLAKGVIAYTEGSVSGGGRIDWTGDEITSSGAFRTQDLDLAAAFGPVQGLAGEVRFSDLLNLTTEPSQRITIRSINPGIEALAGKVLFSMTNGEIIDIEDARWPFMGGTLVMEPTRLRYGTDEEQRYAFTVTALDAAKFVTQMELTNLSATGTFDGSVPIIFDANGNGRIEGGALMSRSPGGNVSYIGELTYEDMGAISNYAFQSLRSLDYRRMDVDLDGDLAGEIITRFRIDGVRQGEDASQNFITRRLARLPIRFNVNVRSENFYELATMVRTFWDPEAIPDPVARGVLKLDGARTAPSDAQGPPENPSPQDPYTPSAPSEAIRPDEPGVQPPESETMP